jgi:hypothetical protein
MPPHPFSIVGLVIVNDRLRPAFVWNLSHGTNVPLIPAGFSLA